MADAVRIFEGQLRDARAQILLLETQRKQWEIEKLNQQAIIHNALTASNTTSNSYLEENQRLREEIARLKG